MERLLYIAPNRSTFVLQDIKVLREHFNVTPYFFQVKYKLFLPFYMKWLFLTLLFQPKQNFLVSFGGYHSFIATLVAKLKGVESFIILNGVDSANIPEFKYGYLRGGTIRWCCKISYQWATKLLPVSESLMNTTSIYGFQEPKKLGLKNEFPDHKFNYEVIPNGFNLDFWKSVSSLEKGSFLTVVGSEKRIDLKGLDIILKVAPEFPDSIFYVVGLDQIENAPENVRMLGYLNSEELRKAYSKSQFYLQLSAWEGFGCALCESMLCGCIPIGSNANIIPEIIGDSGYIVKKRTLDCISETIQIAMNLRNGEILSKKAETRIVENFGIKKRIYGLIKSMKITG